MELTVRYAKRDELERVNELRRAVSELHANGRPDIFRPGFGGDFSERVYSAFDEEDTDVIAAVCGGTDQGDVSRGKVSAADFQSARQALPWVGEEELALTNISYIIVGAEADLSEALGLILSDHEMSPSATVWLTQDAGALLDACEDPAARLAVLEEQGVEAPTVVMVLAALKTDGQVELPVLSLADGRLEPAGQAVWEEKV